MAFSYHYRHADLNKALSGQVPWGDPSISENRIGLDGKWDIGIGLWFEGVLIHQDIDISQFRYQRLINVGLDYTFDLGNGLSVIGEYFTAENAEKASGPGKGIAFSALSLNYPLGLIDNLTAIMYYDWENDDWYRFMNWERKYDNWRLYFTGFWNPDPFQVYQNPNEVNLFAGKGLQVMIVFDH